MTVANGSKQQKRSNRYKMHFQSNAEVLLQEYLITTNQLTNKEAESLFIKAFLKIPTVIDAISQLSLVQQRPNEKYCNFKILVKKLVAEITRMFVIHGLRSDKSEKPSILIPICLMTYDAHW